MKHQTSRTRLQLLLAATVVTVITWASCHSPEPGPDHPVCDPRGLTKHIIPDSVAAQYQQRFLSAYGILQKIAPDTFLAHHFRIPNAETFSKEALCAMINYPGVDSVRIFYGEDTTGGFRLIIKGVDSKGNTIVTKFQNVGHHVSDSTKPTTKSGLQDDDDGDALENGQTCPPCMVPIGPGNN